MKAAKIVQAVSQWKDTQTATSDGAPMTLYTLRMEAGDVHPKFHLLSDVVI